MEINRALIIDTETSGLDENSELIEIGLILYSVTNQCSLIEFSTLLPAAGNEAESVNRIKPSALSEIAEVGEKSSIVLDLLNVSDCLVAHNADFDSNVLRKWSLFFDSPELPPWLCTMEDFRWPLGKQQGSLINLALDHGIGVASAHRALTDCRLIAALFDRMTDLQSMFQVAMRPKGLFVGMQPFDDNQKAKDAGFKWDRLVPRKWARRMAIEDAATLNFPVHQVAQ